MSTVQGGAFQKIGFVDPVVQQHFIATLRASGSHPLLLDILRRNLPAGGAEEPPNSVVRDDQNQFAGRTSDRFDTTRDDHGNLVSINTSDPGLLINRKE